MTTGCFVHVARLAAAALVVLWAASAAAAPNVANSAQKGSLLIFPDVRVDDDWNTLIRIENDGTRDVDLKCFWLDGNRNRVNFTLPLTRGQALWFDARSGHGTFRGNRFPVSSAGGMDNPFLIGPGGVTEDTDTSGPYRRGWLICFVVNYLSSTQVKWNHLSGTATVYHPVLGAYEYNAYAFYAPLGLDLDPIGIPGILNLNGVEYDSCPLYQIGQFSPNGAGGTPGAPLTDANRLALVTCSPASDPTFAWTRLQFDVWSEDEIKFTGAFECAYTWHETTFGSDLDAAAQNFDWRNLGTFSARYRVQGFKGTPCEAPNRITQNVGILAVHSSTLQSDGAPPRLIGTTLAAAGKFAGRLSWTPSGPVPEVGR
jgi:hypothetical protein